MMQTIKVEKMRPRGSLVGLLRRTGVQRKTKIYMEDSAQVWISPNTYKTVVINILDFPQYLYDAYEV